MGVKLIVSAGKWKGREIPLPPTLFLIGRGAQCHLRPHCSSVSKLHCAIACWAGKVLVRDLKSANGTFVNGQRIDEARIADGDELQVGANLRFTFRIRPPQPGEPPLPVVHETDIKWLLDSLADPDLAGAGTAPIPMIPPPPAEGANLSAGQHLRDYLRLRGY